MNQEGLSAAASLVEDLDKRLLVVLRDGRKYVGILRSFDQFSNIVLSDTVERIIVDRQFGDIPLGLYIVRGENVVLMARLILYYYGFMLLPLRATRCGKKLSYYLQNIPKTKLIRKI